MRIKLKRKEAIAGLEGIASLPAVLVVKVSTPPGGLNPGLKANTLLWFRFLGRICCGSSL